MIRILFSLSALLFNTCIHAETATQSPEKILGYVYDREGLTVQVESNGCTTKKDFETNVAESFPAQLSFIRITPDSCRAIFPQGVQLTWTWKELGLNSQSVFRIVNLSKSVSVP